MTAKMVRRAFVAWVVVAVTAAWAGAANTAEAAGIRYFVIQSSGERGQTRTLVPQFQAGLPLVVQTIVSPDTDKDNITGFVRQNNATISRRLPVGTRP
jgi:ABC-type glycerol-3-phosphate transport system substrate-binding protein